MRTIEKLERIRAIELYDWNGWDVNNIDSDYGNGYLIVNRGLNGKEYLWYMDECDCVAIGIDSGDIIGSDECVEIFGIW